MYGIGYVFFNKFNNNLSEKDPYYSNVSMNEALDIMIDKEKSLNQKMSKPLSDKKKDKIFYEFIKDIEYYTQVFSYQNLKANDYEQISTNNKNLKHGLKYNINGIEITPVYTEITPPGVSFPNLKITNPNVPFVKLVFGGWSIDCDRDYSSSTDNCEPSYFALEPDYKYLRNEYGLDLGSTWIDYFDIKIKQQEDLKNGFLKNGNGGFAPYYINKNIVNKWMSSYKNFIAIHSNFIMLEKIADEISYILYPMSVDDLIEFKSNDRVYKRLKENYDRQY